MNFFLDMVNKALTLYIFFFFLHFMTQNKRRSFVTSQLGTENVMVDISEDELLGRNKSEFRRQYFDICT